MAIITSKAAIKPELTEILSAYRSGGLNACTDELNARILQRKVKFPILEYCGEILYSTIPEEEQLVLCDRIEAFKTEGGNVVLGILLRKRLTAHFPESFEKAAEYISKAEVWYVCDIIGERVFGVSLLHEPARTIPEIERLAQHRSNMVVRSLGAGVHYAIKKGLGRDDAGRVFGILLSQARTTDKEIRQGVGWAAKTTAKFYPEIIEEHRSTIDNPQLTSDWFRTKIRIGLNRNRYAQGN
jgi:hypothetical protein